MSEIIRTKVQTHTEVDKPVWKRISTWLQWRHLSISGDTLTLTIKFGDVQVALEAFNYYRTGKRPRRSDQR